MIETPLIDFSIRVMIRFWIQVQVLLLTMVLSSNKVKRCMISCLFLTKWQKAQQSLFFIVLPTIHPNLIRFSSRLLLIIYAITTTTLQALSKYPLFVCTQGKWQNTFTKIKYKKAIRNLVSLFTFYEALNNAIIIYEHK